MFFENIILLNIRSFFEMKKYIWWILVIVVVAGSIYWFGRGKTKAGTELFVIAERGDFEIVVTVTGELQAKNAENIFGPNLQTHVFRWGEYRIQDIVPEGTMVEKGDYVAEIDRSTARNAMIDIEDRIERQEVQLKTVQLDTSIQLRGLRDDLLNRKFTLEEIRIKLEQSIFEPPATIRQIEIELDRAERALEQQHRLYALRSQHCMNWMYDTERTLSTLKRNHEQMSEILAQFTVRAPNRGMVIYRRERSGQKRRAGSSITPNDNIVAMLPDLSVMISRTYVNEIDISKIKVGQQVRIGIDAFPEKRYTGVITTVANIGEQLANADAKVFEVTIEVNETDNTMRPSMTTSNSIMINMFTDVVYVPIEAVFSQDSISFVYTKNNTKQVVLLGESNDNEIIIEQGLAAGDKVFVSIPEGADTWRWAGEELIPLIKERALERKRAQEEFERQMEEQRRARQQQQQQRRQQGGGQRQGGGGRPN